MRRKESCRRTPILPQNPLDGIRRRFAGERRRPPATSGPFLRRVVGDGRLRLGRVSFALGTVWLVVVLVAGEHGWLRQRELRGVADELHAEVEHLETQLQTLRQRSTSATDPYVVEQVARETFGLAQSGEFIYRFDDPEASSHDEERPARLSAGTLDITFPDR